MAYLSHFAGQVGDIIRDVNNGIADMRLDGFRGLAGDFGRYFRQLLAGLDRAAIKTDAPPTSIASLPAHAAT